MSSKTETPGLDTPAFQNTCDYHDAIPNVSTHGDTSAPVKEIEWLNIHPALPRCDEFRNDLKWCATVSTVYAQMSEEEQRDYCYSGHDTAEEQREFDLGLLQSFNAAAIDREKDELAERYELGPVWDLSLEAVQSMVDAKTAERAEALGFDERLTAVPFPPEVIEDQTIHKFANTLVESLPFVHEDLVLITVLLGAGSGCVTHHKTKWRYSASQTGYGNLWAAATAMTGDGKSPIFSHVMEVLNELQAERKLEWDEQARHHKVDLDFAHDQVSALRSQARKEGTMSPEVRGELVELDERIDELTPKARTMPNLITSDTTPEALVEDCSVTGSKSLATDEAGPLRGGFDKYGDGDNIDVWLKGYNGDPIFQSRISGSRHAESSLTHVFVMPQPYALARFETDSESQASGLSQRLLSARPPRLQDRRKLKGQNGPSEELLNHFQYVLRDRLLQAPEFDEYQYSDRAIEVLDDFRDDDEWNKRWALGGDLHPIQFFRAKLDGAMLRMGLVLHILNGHGEQQQIGEDTAKYVMKLAKYFAEQKRDIHAGARLDMTEAAAVALMRWLLLKYNDDANDPPAGIEFDDRGDALFSLAPISRNDVLTSVAGNSKRETVADAVDHAVGEGWLKFDSEPPRDWKQARRCKVDLRADYSVLAADGAPWASEAI